MLVQLALDNQRHHLAFARTERSVTLLERTNLGFVPQCVATPLERLGDRSQRYIVSEWLGQELHRAALHRTYGHRHVAMAGDEDDRHVDAIAGDALLQFETIEVG